MFKLGLDFHGVVDSIPGSLKNLAEAVIAFKGEVHILTGGRKQEVLDELMLHSFAHTHIFSVQDHLNKHHAHLSIGINPKDGMMKYPDELWDCIKAWYCEKNQIDLHLDDTAEYGKYFTTPFARIWTKNNNPKRTDKPARHIA